MTDVIKDGYSAESAKDGTQTYNPRQAILFAQDHAYFAENVPSFLRRTAQMPALQVEG